jgi:hypothetical protein
MENKPKICVTGPINIVILVSVSPESRRVAHRPGQFRVTAVLLPRRAARVPGLGVYVQPPDAPCATFSRFSPFVFKNHLVHNIWITILRDNVNT